jgi:hypothetical protein
VPQTPEVRLGTEQRQSSTGSWHWLDENTTGFTHALNKVTLGFGAGLGMGGARGTYPSGVGHAVPVGAEHALCGRTGLHMWNGFFNPKSRVVTPCPKCKTLAATD